MTLALSEEIPWLIDYDVIVESDGYYDLVPSEASDWEGMLIEGLGPMTSHTFTVQAQSNDWFTMEGLTKKVRTRR